MNKLLGTLTVLVVTTLSQVEAADTGNVVFELKTEQVSGFYLNDQDDTKVVVAPGTNVNCRFRIRNIDEHRAPDGYRGWHIERQLTLPQQDPKDQKPRFDDFFWNAKKFSSPFSPSFAETFTFFDPFTDPPNRREAQFDHDARALRLAMQGAGGFLQYIYTFVLSPSLKTVEKVNYTAIVFGKTDTNLDCTGQAPLSGEYQ